MIPVRPINEREGELSEIDQTRDRLDDVTVDEEEYRAVAEKADKLSLTGWQRDRFIDGFLRKRREATPSK